MDELIPDEAVAVRSGWIDGEEEGQALLIDLIDAQDAREGRHDPGLVVLRKVEGPRVVPAPAPDHRVARADPEVAGQTRPDPRHSHAIVEDRGDGFGNDAVRVDCVRAQEGRLEAKMMAARRAVMNAHRDLKEDGVSEID